MVPDEAPREPTTVRPEGLDRIDEWLVAQGLLANPIGDILAGVSQRLIEFGVPVVRAHIDGTALHPIYEAMGATWTADGGVETVRHRHGSSLTDTDWLSSPLKRLLDQVVDEDWASEGAAAQDRDDLPPLLAMKRYHLERGEGLSQFRVLQDFADRGCTDYTAFVVAYAFGGLPVVTDIDGVVGSWTTDRAGGFTDRDLAVLRWVSGRLALAIRPAILYGSAVSVTSSYLGRDAGHRVLTGAIRRGEVETIDAAILLADLRGFTRLADRYPHEKLVATLDDYLECMADPVQDNGGQILKFLGDGLLGTFDLTGAGRISNSRAALSAAEGALDAVQALNLLRAEAGEPTMALDVALHVGEVLYGNVGSERRLDFTVIGPAVNEVSRMETLCAELHCNLVASASFVDAAAMANRFMSLGQVTLRGIGSARELFTLRPAGQLA